MFLWTLILALVVSAVSTVPALADEGTPPATDIPSTETPPAEETSLPVAEFLAAVPEGTDVIVINEEGETVPLATQEAVEAILTSDPQWCPAGVTPGSATCSGVKDSFNGAAPATDLIAWLTANPKTSAGVIWIEASYTSGAAGEGGPVILNGANYGTTKDYALTINGGWTGTGTTLNSNTPSTFNVPFSVTGWNNAVTINNILISGASGAGYALNVGTTGNVTLTNVDVQDNTTTLGGASVDNDGGLGNVVINDSTFNGNGNGHGLLVTSAGTITAKNLSAIGNGGYGAILDNSVVPAAKAVTLTGSNNFKFNLGGDGLYVASVGAITLSNITAIGNVGGSGAYIDNCLGFDLNEFCLNGVASAVTLKGVNVFNDNGWDGLRVWSPGVITVNGVTANANGTDAGRPAANVISYYDYTAADDYDGYGKGAFLNNWGSWVPKAITLTGTNVFNGNASNGLFALSYSTIKANNVTTSYNNCFIAYDTDISYCAGTYLNGNGITLTGNNTFFGNDAIGLQALSFNTLVTLNNLYAEGNGSAGVFVYNDGPKPSNVSILGTNVFNGNGADGLAVVANGMVTLSNVTANLNNGSGVDISNTLATTAKGVSITGTNTFGYNNSTGLNVLSYGAIVTNNLTAQFNGAGVVLDNCNGVGSCTGYSPQAITMNGLNTITDNDTNGLLVVSQGAIKVNNLTANFNDTGWGAVLDNRYTNAVGGITLTGYGSLSNNGSYGLLAWSTGVVTLANLTANNNDSAGVVVENNYNNLKPAAVTITGINQFNNNYAVGLTITSFGTVVLNNLTANSNGDPSVENGVYVNNSGSLKPMGVTLNGINTFNDNFGIGLVIESFGAILVNKLTANGNNDGGADLDNQLNTGTAPITLLGYAVLNDNIGDGLAIYSNGAVTLNNVTANSNAGYGTLVNNNYNLLTTSAVNVVLNGVNTFNENTLDGLRVISDGLITLNNVTANNNGGFGAYLDNFTAGNLLKNILINGTNNFVANSSSGLYFNTSGTFTVTRITADANNDGVGGAPQSDGIEGTAVGNITLTCGSLTDNEGDGYNLVSTSGIITLKGIFTYGNLLGNNFNIAPVITRTCPLP